MLSAPIGADLLEAKSWIKSNVAASDQALLNDEFHGWFEGNAVVLPSGSVGIFLRVDAKPLGDKAALAMVSADGHDESFDPSTGIISMPGGSVKFTVRCNPQTEKYWSITNVLPTNGNPVNPRIVRNTLALVRSRDLHHWKWCGRSGITMTSCTMARNTWIGCSTEMSYTDTYSRQLLKSSIEAKMEKVFLSYRREDSREITARINDWFDMYFGRGLTFRDIDSLQAGRDFPADIKSALDSCSVGVVIMGERWAEIGSEQGTPRIMREADYVRMEISQMLKRNVPIITVLLNDADMPRKEQVPEEIRRLIDIGAARVRTGRDFPSHVHFLAANVAEAGKVRLENYPDSVRGFRKIGLTAASVGHMSTNSLVLGEIHSARDILIVMNDGRGFLDSQREMLKARTSDPSKRTRVAFLHPSAELLKLPAFLKKVEKNHQAQVHDIARGFRALRSARPESPIEMRGSHTIFPCTYVISENYAFQSPYLCTGGGVLPILEFASASEGSPFYKTLLEDAEIVFGKAIELKETDFPADM